MPKSTMQFAFKKTLINGAIIAEGTDIHLAFTLPSAWFWPHTFQILTSWKK